MSREEHRPTEGHRGGQKTPELRAEAGCMGGVGRAWLTVVHQGQGDLVFGFSVLELSCVRPFVLLTQVLDDHFHQALLSLKIDFAVLGRTNPRFTFALFQSQGICIMGTYVQLDLESGMCRVDAIRDGEGALDNPLLLMVWGSPPHSAPNNTPEVRPAQG